MDPQASAAFLLEKRLEASVFNPKPVVSLEGEVERTHQMDAKREKRLLANKESAKRSRRKKKEHLKELETQVSQMKAENSSLLERVSEMSLKLNNALADKRVLKADIETLRAKVAMAEETFKRITGMQFVFPTTLTVPQISTMSIPSYADAHHFDQSLCYNSHEIQNGLLDIPLLNNAWQLDPATTAGMNNNMEVMMGEETVETVQSLENLPNCTSGFNPN